MHVFSIFGTPNKFIISATFSFTTFNVAAVLSWLLEDEIEEPDLALFFVAEFADGVVRNCGVSLQVSLLAWSQEIKVSSAFCNYLPKENKIGHPMSSKYIEIYTGLH